MKKADSVKKIITTSVDKSKLDPGISTESAIRGILAALGDRHTVYIPPEAFTLQSQDLAGEFEGIGAHVSMRADGKLVIVSPISGGPAELAGIRPGDIILEVDEQSIDGLTLLEAVSKILISQLSVSVPSQSSSFS